MSTPLSDSGLVTNQIVLALRRVNKEQACCSAFFTTTENSFNFDFWDLFHFKGFNFFMILTDLEEKNSIKVSNSQNKWGLKSVVKNAFQATQAEIASNMPAPSSPSLILLIAENYWEQKSCAVS